MNKKQEYQKKLQAQLDEWSADIDKLKAKADKAEADAKLDYQKQVEHLRSMKEDASKKMSELNRASDVAWEDLKSGMDSAWSSLDNAVKVATARFK
jgi:hypothetical protein